MKKRIIIFIVILSILIVAGVFLFLRNRSYNTPNYNEESKTLIHKDFKATINADWQELEIPPSTYAYFPLNMSQEDVNAEVISVVITFLSENNQITLEELLEQGIEISKQIMPNFELIENISTDKLGMPSRKIIFTGTQYDILRQNTQYFGIKYNNLYSVTYSCPINNCNYYNIYDKFIESFQAIKAK